MARRSRGRVLWTICAADLLVTLDGTVVTVALPAIQRDLEIAAANLQWVVTAYTMTLGAFLLIGGRAADHFGRRKVLMAGLVVFVMASAAAGLAPAVLPDSRDESSAGLDVRGVVLAAVSLGLLSLGIAQIEHRSPAALPLLAGAALLLAVFVWAENRSRAPMVRPSVFRHRPLRGANLAIMANAGAFGGLMFITTLNLQQVLGYDALRTGFAYVPLALSACVGGLVTPRILDSIGARRTAVVSMSVTAATFLLLAWRAERLGVLIGVFLVSGFTFAAAFVPLTSEAMNGVRDGEKGLASGLFQTSTHLGGALVLTVLATAAAFRSSAALHNGVPNASALTSGFSLAFLIGAAFLALGATTALRTLPPAPVHVR